VDANGNLLKRMYEAQLGNIVHLAQKVLGSLSPFEVSCLVGAGQRACCCSACSEADVG
jgi:hypothetical protein